MPYFAVTLPDFLYFRRRLMLFFRGVKALLPFFAFSFRFLADDAFQLRRLIIFFRFFRLMPRLFSLLPTILLPTYY